jgi:hypothetical protein
VQLFILVFVGVPSLPDFTLFIYNQLLSYSFLCMNPNIVMLNYWFFRRLLSKEPFLVFLYVEKYFAYMKKRREICLYKSISLMPSLSVVFVGQGVSI